MAQTNWVRRADVNNKDELHQKCRSRFVVKEFESRSVPALHAAVPPTECLRIVASPVVFPVDIGRGGEVNELMACNVSRACLLYLAIMPVYVRIADEVYQPVGEHVCGRFNASMHGTRDTVMIWLACMHVCVCVCVCVW